MDGEAPILVLWIVISPRTVAGTGAMDYYGGAFAKAPH